MKVLRYALLLALVAGLAVAAWAQDPTPEPADAASAATPTPAPTAKAARPIQLTSPIDGASVEGWEVEAFATRGVDTDFCYLNASADYYQKLIATDPHNGYTGYVDDFFPNLKQPLPAKVVEKIKKKLPKEFDLAHLEPWDRYEIVAKIYEWRGLPAKDIGNAYLRATYTMRDLAIGHELQKHERALRAKAIKNLRRALTSAQFTLPEMAQVKYLIGELYRRNAKFNAAVRYFEDAAKMKNRPEWLDEMIIRQKARAYAYDAS